MPREFKITYIKLVEFLKTGDKSEKDVMEHFDCTANTARAALTGGVVFNILERKQVIGTCPECHKFIEKIKHRPYFVYRLLPEDMRKRVEYDG